MHIHIHIHYDCPQMDELVKIRESLTLIKNQLTKMADDNSAAFDQVLARIDTATNGLATEINDLKGQIQGTGMPKDKEDQVLNTLSGIASRLEALGKPEETGGGDTQPPIS